MRFLLPSMVAATMLIAIGAIGSKAEAAMMPECRNSASSNENLYACRKGLLPTILSPWLLRLWPPYYGYGYRPYYGYGYGYRPYGYYGYGWRPEHKHRHRTWLGLGLLKRPLSAQT